jgi:hypothetical protein
MRTSESIAALAAALAKAQAVIEGAVKDKMNPAFRSKYADLAAVWDAIREPLTANGLSLVQMPDMVEGDPVLVTRLLHSSGEWLEGTYPLTPVKQDPQGYGSAISYARRYAAMAVCGVAPEDDDGNAASGRSDKAAPVATKAAPAAAAISPEMKAEADNLKAIIDNATGEVALGLIMKNSKELLEKLPPAAAKYLKDRAEKHLAMLQEKD